MVVWLVEVHRKVLLSWGNGMLLVMLSTRYMHIHRVLLTSRGYQNLPIVLPISVKAPKASQSNPSAQP